MKRDQLQSTVLTFSLAVVIITVAGCGGSGPSTSSSGKDSVKGALGPTGGRTATTSMMYFGNPSKGGCSGKGICNSMSVADSIQAGQGTVTLTSENSSDTPGIINFSFPLGQLQGTEQYDYFAPPATSYVPEVPYDVSTANPLFLPLGLPAGSIIGTNSSSTLSYDQSTGIVNNALGITISKPVTAYVILGLVIDGKWYYGNEQGGTGILAAYSASRPQIKDTPATTAFTFSLQQGNASNLLISFDWNQLNKNEPAQTAFFPQQNGNCGFYGSFSLSDPMWSPLGLPASSSVPGILCSYTYVQSSSTVVDTISNYYYVSTNTDLTGSPTRANAKMPGRKPVEMVKLKGKKKK